MSNFKHLISNFPDKIQKIKDMYPMAYGWFMFCIPWTNKNMVYANFSLNLPVELQRFEFADLTITFEQLLLSGPNMKNSKYELNKAYLHNDVVICLPHAQLKRNSLNLLWVLSTHDDVKWKHFPSYWPFVRGIHRSPANSPHKGQRRRALMFSLICAWINRWVSNREAGDLRRYRAHYDVIVKDLGSSTPGGNTWWIQQVPMDIHSLVMKNTLQRRRLWLIK